MADATVDARSDADTSPPRADADAAHDAAPRSDARPEERADATDDATSREDAAPAHDAAPLAACETLEPNDDLAGAQPLPFDAPITTCLGNDDDIDFYTWDAPSDPAGGALRVEVLFEECQLAFSLYDSREPGYEVVGADTYWDHDYPGQVDHRLVHLVALGAPYHFTVFARRPFEGSCSYTVQARWIPLEDPYEPNQESEDATPLAIGETLHPYFQCLTTERTPLTQDCDDSYSIALPAGTYQLNISMPSAPYGVNPCVAMGCSVGSRSTHSYFRCQETGGLGHGFGSLFTLGEASDCYVRVSGSSAGGIAMSNVAPYEPRLPDGADEPYDIVIMRADP